MKTCAKCKAEKEESEFQKDAKRKDQLYVYCKECSNLSSKAYYASLGKGSKKDRIKRQRELRAEARRLGRCTDCLSPAAPGHSECEKCLAAHREFSREHYERIKDEAFEHYGGYVCACCGEVQKLFLSMDHINNDGAAHRREITNGAGPFRGAGYTLYRWLKKNNFPPGFQVYCMNCNWGKRMNHGICPHQTAKEA